ncbi:MAG TPA: NAD(P)/FAD-dependent oxidoreductase [Bradyrhizobium sp.]|jgi:2-polyprenyl-6-methoxyphenol hydroxylase-like FAD-dependent oxidoreductase
MKYTDIAIIGGGLAGSTAAAMLGRASIATILIDPHPVYPPDFRVEKLSGAEQLARFRKTGLAEAILPQATHDGVNWIARFGTLLDKVPSQQFGMAYDTLVNAIRREIPEEVEQIFAKAVSVSTSDDRQKVTLSNDEVISARLVVIANGLNVGLRQVLGIRREITSRAHSISIGFDIAPVGRHSFDFPALTYFSERPSDRIPYISLFPIGERMRANLFTYRDPGDVWLRELRVAPAKTLNAALPRLKEITGAFAVCSEVKIRPADLYVNSGYRRAGIVLVGDAFASSCPVTGTGTDKVFTDVAQLCNIHIPAWLVSEGTGEDKIAAFYNDPVKQACDAWAMEKAYSFRSVSIDEALYWRMQRWARYFSWLGSGLLRRAGIHLETMFGERAAAPAPSSRSSSSISSV